jgi:GNAT superfamily N-acetyltransferase
LSQDYGLAIPDLRLRSASSADGEQVSELLADLGYEVGRSEVTERVQRLTGLATSRVVVAEREGRLLGLLTPSWGERLTHRHPVARVTELLVRKDARRLGIGRQLVQSALILAREAGCGEVELTTSTARPEAHLLYESLGFRRTSYRYVRTV